MAKTEALKPHIRWTQKGDALRPIKTPHGFVLRNPFLRALRPGEAVDINTGISADCPLLAWPVTAQVTVEQLFVPGKTVTVRVTNSSEHSVLSVESKEALAVVYPLFLGDVTEDF